MKTFISMICVISCFFVCDKPTYELQAILAKEYNSMYKYEDSYEICYAIPINVNITDDTLYIEYNNKSIAYPNSDSIRYEFVGSITKTPYLIIKYQDYNDQNYILVNLHTREEIKLLCFMRINERKDIVTYDMPSSDHYCGIKCYKYDNEQYHCILHIKENDWYPRDVLWHNNNEFVVEANEFQSGSKLYYRCKIASKDNI